MSLAVNGRVRKGREVGDQEALRRVAFETSRKADYLDAGALEKETGRRRSRFAEVALKELCDNALDACESGSSPGVAPEVGIEVRDEPGAFRLAVSDNGPGIPPGVVEKVLDFGVRVSDKAAYRSPTRGAQGSALKTVVGIPYALGGTEPVTIEARGVRHEVRAWADPSGELRVEHETQQVPDVPGTRVSLAIPSEGQVFEPERWALAFAMYNPHATVRFSRGPYLANGDDRETLETYKPGVPYPDGKWRKYAPHEPTSAHWYDEEALSRLVFSHVTHARRGGRDLPVGEFVRQFDGLKSTKKAKAVVAEAGLADLGVTHLSGLEGRPEKVGDLLGAMRNNSRAPKHDRFGSVGEEHFRRTFEAAYGELDAERDFKYRKAKGRTPGGLPFVFEFALAVLEDGPGDLFFGVNFAPTFDDPLSDERLACKEFEARGVRAFLAQGYALPAEGSPGHYLRGRQPEEVAVAVHIITPAPVFLDRGKTRLLLTEEETGAR